MRIAIIGGHGKIALQLGPLLAGHDVDAVVRNPDHGPDVEAAGMRPVVADVETMSREQMTELLRGHDAVVWTAGAGGGDPERTYAVDRDAAIRSMDAAQEAGAERYLMVSYLGARTDHGVPEDNPFFAYAEAKAAADEHLRGSQLDWTIVAPGALSLDAGTGQIEVMGDGTGAIETPEGRDVPRADVATVLALALDRDDLTGRMIEFLGGSTPVAQALDAVAGKA
ncbi:NAD-dependent dehydratase [Serinicoccus chungangensis]|uniref:NAD-dependent dehydratase n=1 Tax=Serinicoccus chungangensis TaxID=767452 RepID=A0A0W8IBR2_9MICO|nr:SDR family oxidoreductase [Serinicoccus chungangensis]KUG57393.1 NAD-dependent dehydratase [Serinicoccus chungangensis]